VQLVEKASVTNVDHSKKCEKKRDGPSSFFKSSYIFGLQTFTKKKDEMQ
jgi:hypothetical protein